MNLNKIYMNKNFFIGIAAIFFLGACAGQSGFKKTASGFEYNLLKDDTEGRTVKMGDFLTLNMSFATMNDSSLFNTFSNKEPLNFKLQESLFNGAINEGLMMMSEGDSAQFLVPASKVYGDQLPEFLKADDKLKYTVSMMKVASATEQQKEMEASMAAQIGKDDEALTAYIKEKGYKAEKTENGLYYVVNKEGNGQFPKAGQKVKVHYTGTLLNGEKFDSSKDRDKEFEFPLGQGRVIKGWDEGIPKFSKGGSGILLIPSSLGYGTRGAGPKIPANAPLIFEIELIDFQ